MTDVIDIHTHHLPISPELAIWNYMSNKDNQLTKVDYASVGIHPWYISPENVQQQKEWLLSALQSPKVIALGETGLDKLSAIDFTLQNKLFRFHIELSEQRNLPLILHVVKAHNEVMQLHSLLRPRQPWIIHGFRGKPELAQQYLKEGIMLSFGSHYNIESLKLAYQARMLFFETDESMKSIDALYKEVAPLLHIDAVQLELLTRQNADKVFFSR